MSTEQMEFIRLLELLRERKSGARREDAENPRYALGDYGERGVLHTGRFGALNGCRRATVKRSEDGAARLRKLVSDRGAHRSRSDDCDCRGRGGHGG